MQIRVHLWEKRKTKDTTHENSKLMSSKTPFNWGKLLKIVIAVLTALAGSIGLASCAQKEASPTPPEEGLTIIAESIMTCQYENAFTFREV